MQAVGQLFAAEPVPYPLPQLGWLFVLGAVALLVAELRGHFGARVRAQVGPQSPLGLLALFRVGWALSLLPFGWALLVGRRDLLLPIGLVSAAILGVGAALVHHYRRRDSTEGSSARIDEG